MHRKGKEKKPEGYKLELIHDSNKGVILALDLCNSRSASKFIYLLQSCTEGFLFLNIASFLTIQTPQEKRMKMSRENSTFSNVFQA